MKTLKTILTLCACSIPVLSAQTAAPETKEAPAGEAVADLKPETPVEEQAFKVFDIISVLPGIVGSIKDDVSAGVAKTKLEAMATKLTAQVEELKKLEVPDNEARTKLSAKMKMKDKGLDEGMRAAMVGMSTLPESTALLVAELMNEFGQKMESFTPTMHKYFKPDKEDTEDEGE